MEVDIETDGQSQTELDSHANMPVVRSTGGGAIWENGGSQPIHTRLQAH